MPKAASVELKQRDKEGGNAGAGSACGLICAIDKPGTAGQSGLMNARRVHI
jgi:hypothetical protein